MIRYVSIDLETTGLDPKSHDILEIGAIVDIDGVTRIDELPRFHCYVKPKRPEGYVGDPFALAMNAGILNAIVASPDKVFAPEAAMRRLTAFLDQHFSGQKPTGAGKNFATFDLPFLKEYPGCPKFAHRVADPGSMYLHVDDEKIPDLMTCCKRAGVAYDNAQAHNALYDAGLVISLIRLGARYE